MVKQTKIKLPEKDIQAFVLDFLLAKRIGHFWRNNTVGVFDRKNDCYRKNAKQENGIADILGVLHGRFIAIECKATGINKLREDQEIFKVNVENSGGIFFLANDIDEFSGWIKCLEHTLFNNLYENS